MTLWSSEEIAAATEGMASASFTAGSVTFDSREVEPGSLFVALKGAATDGHRFVSAAFAADAAGAVVSEPADGPHVRVADTMAALEALAHAARARARAATVIGVTGSVGKTTVKELLRAAFAAHGPTHASVKSYNNHTGVPLSLARMPAATRWAVFEMGMNHAGEIAALTAQVRPHVAVVTRVGVAHIEHFDGPEGIADAKAEIFGGLEPNGAAVIPFDDAHRDRLIGAALMACERVVTFGEGDGARVRAVAVREDGDGMAVEADVAGTRVALHLPRLGRHHVHNALAALAAVYAAAGDVRAAAVAIAGADPLAGRGRILATPGGARVLDEAYNANPDSMAAALATLRAAPALRKLAVLGAMKELGTHGPAAHAALAPLTVGIAELALVGDEMAPLAAALPRAVRVPDADAALAWATERMREGDLILVKGSNSVGLARVVAGLTEG